MTPDRVTPVAILGTNGGVCFSELGFFAGHQAIGMNTGNALFQYAMWQYVASPKIPISPNSDVEDLKGRVRALVIPAANQVNPAWDLGGWADLVERLDAPVVIAGLGAQAEIHSTAKLELKPGTLRFLSAVSERANSIGVRGAFTQEVLAQQGILNTTITGCPSQHLNRHIDGHTIARRIERVRRVPQPKLVHIFGTMEPHTRETERILFQLGRQHNARIMHQTNLHLLRYLYDGALADDARKSLVWQGSILAPEMPGDEFLRVMKWRGCFFSDARSWIDAMSAVDLALGMRIHGAIAAIQGGSLGICVAFDSRTKELVDAMGYPHIEQSRIGADDTVLDILDKTDFSPESFDQKRAELRGRLVGILRDGGFAVSQHLSA